MRQPDNLYLSELAHMERILVAGLADGFPGLEVTEADLTDQVARAGFRAVRALQRQGLGAGAQVDIDPIALREQLVATGEADAWQHLEAVRPVTSGEFEAALHITLRESQRRRVLAACRRVARLAEDEGREMSAAELAEKASTLMGAACTSGAGDRLITDDEALAELEERLVAGTLREGYVQSGNDDLDAITGGQGPGELRILACRPGVGKSALGLQHLTHVIRNEGPALLVSLEMSAREIVHRMAQQISRVSKKDLSVEHVRTARNVIRKGPLIIADHGANVDLLAARIARVKLRHPNLALVAVDYLGLMKGDPRAKRYEEVAGVARRLKLLAQQHRVPILALHQLSRDVTRRQDRRPELQDLREAGEEDANQVLFLYRPGYDQNRDVPGPAELIVRKNRSGGVGTVHLWWEPEIVTYSPRRDPDAPPNPADDEDESYGLPPNQGALDLEMDGPL